MKSTVGAAVVVAILQVAALVLPVVDTAERTVYWFQSPLFLLLWACLLGAAVLAVRWRSAEAWSAFLIIALSGLGASAPLLALDGGPSAGPGAGGFWCFLAAVACTAALGLRRLAAIESVNRWMSYAVAAVFGAWVLYFWQALVQGFAVPKVLLPSPGEIWIEALAHTDVLAMDFSQTVLKSVLIGFAFGSGLGFTTAILIDRSPFLQRGLLPLSALASAVPLVGVAPILVMWFGFDWHSKAALIVLMTFFPMLVNTLSGLHAAGLMEMDLMRSYGAGYCRTLVALRLPTALPFVFNALKINSTLALIGAIVGEFFGSPTVGMGFRISTEAFKMNMGLVWASILVAALAGSIFYGLLS